MTRSWGDVMMDGNPDSTMTGILGKPAALIVVDDPIGCVAPSEGVKIVGPSNRDILRACQMINMGPDYLRDQDMRKKQFEESPGPRYDRKKARKPKQRRKGLRP